MQPCTKYTYCSHRIVSLGCKSCPIVGLRLSIYFLCISMHEIHTVCMYVPTVWEPALATERQPDAIPSSEAGDSPNESIKSGREGGGIRASQHAGFCLNVSWVRNYVHTCSGAVQRNLRAIFATW